MTIKKWRAGRGGPARNDPPTHSHSARRARRRVEPALDMDGALEQAVGKVLAFAMPADRALAEFFRAHRFIGRRDRGAIADRLFDILRQRRLYAHLAESGSGSQARRLALIADARQARPVMRSTPAEQAWLERLARVDAATLPAGVRLSLPDWLLDSLQAQPIPGEGGAMALAASLLEPAALDVRVNLLKTDMGRLGDALQAAGIESQPIARGRGTEPGTARRLTGHPALEQLDSFRDGWFEVQDAGSQWVSWRAGARRGEAVVDFCAGAGGKTLAMAAMMRGSGQIYACDTSATRLARLKPRLARSGASNVQPMHLESEHDRRLRRLWGRIDLVFVDAPCSGSGTLRRNPDLKWRRQPGDIARLARLQLSILQAAARLLKPGGRLIYVTCSLLAQENEAVALAFEDSPAFPACDLGRLDLARSGFEWADTDTKMVVSADSSTDSAHESGFVRLWPHLDGTDGFFMAGWRRRLA